MPLIKVKSLVRETNLGLIFSRIESTSQDFMTVEMVIRTEDVQAFFPLEDKIVLKLYSGEYLVISGDIDELLYEIDTAENSNVECEIEFEEKI